MQNNTALTTTQNTALNTAQKKKLLIAQGAMYRLGVMESKNAVHANLQPAALAKNALDSVVMSVSSVLGHRFSLKNFSHANFQTVLPLAISGISLLVKRRSLIKPLLIGAIILGAASAIARYASRNNPER